MNRNERAASFRTLHTKGNPLVLINAWDVPSAVMVQQAGYSAVATTSAGVAWTYGYTDGDALPMDLVRLTVERMAARLDVPLSVDMEAGFSADMDTVVNNVVSIAELGAVGMNFEDTFAANKTGVRDIGEQCAIIKAIRAGLKAKGLDFFINARTDRFLYGLGDPATRLDDTIARGQAYAEAGADGLFAPGVGDLDVIRRIAKEVPLPLNILALPSMTEPDIRTKLADAGVARISVGSRAHGASVAHFRDLAASLRDATNFGTLFDSAIIHAEMQKLMG